MQTASWPQRQFFRRSEPAFAPLPALPLTTSIPLVPRATILSPDRLAQDISRMRHPVIYGVTFGDEVMDVLGLVAVDEFEHVVSLAFDSGEEGSTSEWIAGAIEDEIIGKTRGGDGEVCAGAGGPFIC